MDYGGVNRHYANYLPDQKRRTCMSTLTKENVIQTLQDAFSNWRKPNAPISDCSLEEAMVPYLSNRIWNQITLASLRQAGGLTQDWLFDLFYKDPEYFVYFLPGFLLLCLQEEPVELDRWVDVVLFLLSRNILGRGPPDPERSARFDDVFCGYNHQQKRAIALYVRYQVELATKQRDDFMKENAEKTYASYWVRFDPNPLPPVPAAER